jgi:RNA polymerase sigma-70 factor (ECF subfamily)
MDSNPENIALMQAERRELLENVFKLSVPLREILILFYYHGFSEKEITDILKIPAGTVRSRLYRSKETLKYQLNNGGNEHESD